MNVLNRGEQYPWGPGTERVRPSMSFKKSYYFELCKIKVAEEKKLTQEVGFTSDCYACKSNMHYGKHSFTLITLFLCKFLMLTSS